MSISKDRRDRIALRRSTGTSRIVNESDAPDRRAFLRVMALQGVSVPAAYFLLSDTGADARVQGTIPVTGGKGGMRPNASATGAVPKVERLVRDFADPYIELIRLLREACEIEHALMIQYLYGAFSLKPTYEDVRGNGNPNTTDLLGVAVQEMQHLGKVNRLLVDLGAAPSVMRQDFPFEPDIYPFEFCLEPLSRKSVAKYLYTEAPAGALKWSNAKTEKDRHFLNTLDRELGATRPNHVGSFYDAVLQTVEEVERIEHGRPTLLEPIDLKKWKQELIKIKMEGEEGHYNFFKQLFLGEHEGFATQHPNVWNLPPHHMAYPSKVLPVNPSAYVGHPNQIADPVVLSIAWLGNLHYWVTLFLLDLGYRTRDDKYVDLARQNMMGPLIAIARHLPTIGAGLPFDPLSMGYAPGVDARHSEYVIVHMMEEADKLATTLRQYLPDDYPGDVIKDTLTTFRVSLKIEGR